MEHPTKNIWVEIVGWYGALALLAAYALVSFSVLDASALSYQILNTTGAVGIVIVSLYKKTYQPGILNIVWALVGIVALIKIFS